MIMETSEARPASAPREALRWGMRFAALFGITTMLAAAWLAGVSAAVGLFDGGQMLYGWDAFWPVFTGVSIANVVVMLTLVAIVALIAWAERSHP